MHEMSLIEGVLRVLEEQAVLRHFTKVKTVWLEIGELSAVDPESLLFCFNAIRAGTLAEDALLEIVRLPGIAFCTDCAKQVNVAERYACCPECGGERLQVSGGDEMRIKELEVE